MPLKIKNSSRNLSREPFFAAYTGSSMNPTLRELEMMELMSYDSRPLRVGDVVFFLPPKADRPIVHRVVRMTPAGISTLGDNNNLEDSFLLQPRDITGQVVAAWRGQNRRRIASGVQGRLTSRWLRWQRVLDRGVSSLLHPLYQALAHLGLIRWLLPSPFRPRVVVYHTQDRDQFQILLGQHIIGRYDDQRQQWQIQRPFQLLVNGRMIPRALTKEQLNQRILTEQERTMSPAPAKGLRLTLALADGSRWEIAAGDKQATSVVSQLGCVMQLQNAQGAIEPAHQSNLYRLTVQADTHVSVVNYRVPLASENHGDIVCSLSPSDHLGRPYVNLVRLSLIIAREVQARGGVLIHGALAERDGIGVILAAPGGTGKTTASNRLPAPWRSLCDDATLVVRDAQGNYWAHPWPTWSRFVDGGPGGTWDVQNAVPIKSIFFLIQSVEERVERVGTGQAVSLLGESVGQVSLFMAPGLCKEELRALHLEQFNNLCALARVVRTYLLNISLTSSFWQEIEQTLQGGFCEDT